MLEHELMRVSPNRSMAVGYLYMFFLNFWLPHCDVDIRQLEQKIEFFFSSLRSNFHIVPARDLKPIN